MGGGDGHWISSNFCLVSHSLTFTPSPGLRPSHSPRIQPGPFSMYLINFLGHVINSYLMQHLLSRCMRTQSGPLGLGPVLAAQQEVSGGQESKASSGSPHHAHCRLNHSRTLPGPCPWENCLSRNQSLMPKRLGTAVTDHLKKDKCLRNKCTEVLQASW